MQLFEAIQTKVNEWRAQKFACAYPALAEILDYARLEGESLRFLRKAQLRALETHWYLRVIEKTPHISELYGKYFSLASDRIKALGIPDKNSDINELLVNYGLPRVLELIRTDDKFVRRFDLESLRETLTLDYPSYIFALAMGAGKTILIGTIIATEFAMGLEYPDAQFVKNALVF
ncbi:MAG: restriction endonuclease subunit R, partial [Chloroflexi bacterium]|nr:restriction endonuclease subunit R [Chloroflexota bacterium]